MKDKVIFSLKMFLLVVAASLGLAVLLTICYIVPLDEVNYTLSVEELRQEGWYSDVLEQRPGYDQNFFSEAPGIQPVANDLSDYIRAAGLSNRGPLYNAMAMVDEDGEHYARYWHGYAGILRLLLIIMDCKEIKFLSFAFQLFLVLMVAIGIYTKLGIRHTLLFLTQYLLLMPLTVSISMVFAFSIDIALMGILTCIHLKDKLAEKSRLCYFFCLIGLLTCFFEELVFGILTWGMVILWMILLNGKETDAGHNVSNVVFTGLSWVWGYGGIWFMKWIYASIVMGENIVANGLSSVFERSSSSNFLDEVSGSAFSRLLDRFSALSENYKYYFYTVFFLILAAWIVYLVDRLLGSGIDPDSRIPALGLVSAAPAVWYFLLANHTLGHRFMTYRIWNFGIIAVLAVVLLASEKRSEIGYRIRFKVIMLIVSVLAAGVFTYLKTEKTDVRNLEALSFEVGFDAFEDNVLRTSIVPTFRTIESMGLVMSPASVEGEYCIRLMESDKIVYEKTIAMADFCESSWQVTALDWKVKPGTQYYLEIVPICSEGMAGTVTICDSGSYGIPEMGNLQINEQAGDTQLYTWLVCLKGVSGRKALFWFLTWFTVFVCLFLVADNCVSALSSFKAGKRESK